MAKFHQARMRRVPCVPRQPELIAAVVVSVSTLVYYVGKFVFAQLCQEYVAVLSFDGCREKPVLICTE